MLAIGNEACCQAQDRSFFAEWHEQLFGLVHQACKLLSRPVFPMHGDKRCLAGGGVLACCLAHPFRAGGNVEEIIGELEGEPDDFAELGQMARADAHRRRRSVHQPRRQNG